MWFTKQRDALQYESEHPGFVIAEDISSHGHKRYGVITRDQIDTFTGPYNELIRVLSMCRLYFDLDGPGDTPTSVIDEVIEAVNVRLFAVYGIQAGNVQILCSSTSTKFSKHLIFSNVFRNNWHHMRNFVATVNHELIDHSVYSRNRCFRMAQCHKYGQPTRVFLPGPPSSALVQVDDIADPLEFAGESSTPNGRHGGGPGVAIGSFNMKTLRIKEKAKLTGFQPDDLLKAIFPDQVYHAFFAIGCAYKRAGGSCDFFCEWCKDYRNKSGVTRQWRCWNKTSKGYGYPFLKEVALHCSSTDECSVRLNEAFGFHPTNFPVNVINFNAPYVNVGHITKAKCVLVKSPTGTGKSTVARLIAKMYCNKRILYLVSSRSLAYGARNSLNEMQLGCKLDFVSYLETNKPLWSINHLVCSIQSLWRAHRLKQVPYDLVICDELTSVIEDMTNVTNKHPKENQEAFRFFSSKCERWIGLDAHLIDTSLVLCTDYFKEIDVLVNHHIGKRKNAIFIPRPQWSTLGKIRSKACVPNARPADVQAFSDATCMYDLLFQCWSQSVKTFFICNNVRLGNWVEENYLRRSFTWMALMWAGLCDDLAVLVTDFCCAPGDNNLQRRQFSYEWIHKGDGRDGSAFKSLDWWSKIDHLQYTLKICAGVDFNPKVPHYGVGFAYSTPNTAVPRRVLQQCGRIRKYADNPLYDDPTIFFAIGDRVTVKHLPVVGLREIEEYADKQEYFMQAVATHHSTVIKDYFSYLFKPEALWKKLYLMVMNERETFLRFPREAFRYWLRHDNWSVSSIQSKPKAMIQWQNCTFRERRALAYNDIPLLGDLEYNFLCAQRRTTKLQAQQIKKYNCIALFTHCDESIWKLYSEHPSWIANTVLERFGDLDCVLKRRVGKLVQTQTNTEWTDMLGARLVLVQKLTRHLGLTELWNANGKLVGPAAFKKAERFVERNKDKVKLAFGGYRSVKSILNSWGGHRMTVHTRIRKNGSTRNNIGSHMEFLGSIGNAEPMLGTRLHKTNLRTVLRKMHLFRRPENPSVRMDASIFQIKSPPWNTLRHPRLLA